MKLLTSTTEPAKSYIKVFAEKHKISRREVDVIEAILNEHSNIKDIAKELQLSPSTVNNHLNNIYEKTSTSSKAELISKILCEIVTKYKDCNLLRKTPKILVLDDEVDIGLGLSELLNKSGFKTFHSTNSHEALEKVRDLDLDFIVADIRMPDKDGFEFMTTVRESHRYTPRIIFITGYSNYELPQAQDIGAVTIIHKPINHEQLINVILENYIEDYMERENFLNLAKKYPVFSNEIIPLNAFQVGFGGVFVPLAYKKGRGFILESGARTEIRFSLPNSTKEIPALVEVTWVRSHSEPGLTLGFGAKFINISDTDREEVRSFVRASKIRSFIPLGKQPI